MQVIFINLGNSFKEILSQDYEKQKLLTLREQLSPSLVIWSGSSV